MSSSQIKQIILDSRDRQNYLYSGSESCIFQLPFPLNEVKSISLLAANIPMTMYNVNSSCNVIYLTDTLPRVITLPVGNYDIYSLVSQLETSINLVSSLVFTVTYSLVTMRLLFTATGLFTFTFSNLTNSMSNILGFNNVDSAISAISQTSDNCPNLSIPMYINMSVQEWGTSTKSTNSNDNTTFCLFTNCNNSDVQLYTVNQYYKQHICVMNNNVQQITVRLTDYGNKPLNLNGTNWSALIALHYC